MLAAQRAFDECGRVPIRGVVVRNALGREMGQCIHYPFRRSLSEVVERNSQRRATVVVAGSVFDVRGGTKQGTCSRWPRDPDLASSWRRPVVEPMSG